MHIAKRKDKPTFMSRPDSASMTARPQYGDCAHTHTTQAIRASRIRTQARTLTKRTQQDCFRTNLISRVAALMYHDHAPLAELIGQRQQLRRHLAERIAARGCSISDSSTKRDSNALIACVSHLCSIMCASGSNAPASKPHETRISSGRKASTVGSTTREKAAAYPPVPAEQCSHTTDGVSNEHSLAFATRAT